MPPRMTGRQMKEPPRAKVEAAMREVHSDIPSTVKRADVSGERREKMLRAIAFAKTRARG